MTEINRYTMCILYTVSITKTETETEKTLESSVRITYTPTWPASI